MIRKNGYSYHNQGMGRILTHSEKQDVIQFAARLLPEEEVHELWDKATELLVSVFGCEQCRGTGSVLGAEEYGTCEVLECPTCSGEGITI